MVEAELAGVKRNCPQAFILELFAERQRRAVLGVADDWVTARRGLYPDLVRAAGFQLDFEPGTHSPAILAGFSDPGRVGYMYSREHSVVHHRKFPAGIVGRDDDRLRHAMSLVQMIG